MMTADRGARFAAELATIESEHDRLRAGIPNLHALFRELIAAAVPPNPQFERRRIIEQAREPRELVFLLGLLSEGENEAALLLDLALSVVLADPAAPTDHLVAEAWYYLRTSIDSDWQLDPQAPCASAALAYVFCVLCRRLDRLCAEPPPPAPADRVESDAATLLQSMRDALSPVRAR